MEDDRADYQGRGDDQRSDGSYRVGSCPPEDAGALITGANRCDGPRARCGCGVQFPPQSPLKSSLSASVGFSMGTPTELPHSVQLPS